MTTSLDRPTGPVSVVSPAPAVRWLAVLALALGGFGIGTTEFVAMGLLPDIASSLGITEPTAGHVISAYALGVVIGAPLIAALRRAGVAQDTAARLMAVFTLGNLASVLAPSYGTLMAAASWQACPTARIFGVAALVAAHLMGRQNRAKAVAHVMTGLTVATVVGVPIASWLGQALGWRSAFGLVVVIGAVTLTALWFWLPDRLRSMHVTSPLTELERAQARAGVAGAARRHGRLRRHVRRLHLHQHHDDRCRRLAAVSGSVGAHGLRRWHGGRQPGRRPDGRPSVIRALYLSMGALGVVLAVFVLASHNPWTALLVLFRIGAAGSAIAPALQTRLMDVAHDAQTLAAALNHSALNIGNATGAWVGGLVIAAGFGYTAPAAAGALLAVAGLAVLTVSVVLQRRTLV